MADACLDRENQCGVGQPPPGDSRAPNKGIPTRAGHFGVYPPLRSSSTETCETQEGSGEIIKGRCGRRPSIAAMRIWASTSTPFLTKERPCQKPCCSWETAWLMIGSIRILSALAINRLSVFTMIKGRTSVGRVYSTPSAETRASLFGMKPCSLH